MKGKVKTNAAPITFKVTIFTKEISAAITRVLIVFFVQRGGYVSK